MYALLGLYGSFKNIIYFTTSKACVRNFVPVPGTMYRNLGSILHGY